MIHRFLNSPWLFFSNRQCHQYCGKDSVSLVILIRMIPMMTTRTVLQTTWSVSSSNRTLPTFMRTESILCNKTFLDSSPRSKWNHFLYRTKAFVLLVHIVVSNVGGIFTNKFDPSNEESEDTKSPFNSLWFTCMYESRGKKLHTTKFEETSFDQIRSTPDQKIQNENLSESCGWNNTN